MSSSIWPFNCGDQQYAEPVIIARNKCKINNEDFVAVIEKQPKLWSYMIQNKDNLSSSLQQYIHRISEPFQPQLPPGTIARIKVAETDWQSMENNRYVRLELMHCENYDHYILPFHDSYRQYGFFFIDINKSIETNECALYWQRNKEPDGSYEEYIWCGTEEIEVIYIPTSDEDVKDKQLGFQKVVIKYLKNLNNERLDELEASSTEIFKILISRLRGKCHPGFYGNIVCAQGIMSSGSWNKLDDKLVDIVDVDDEYSKNKNIISYRLTRKMLFCKLQINPMLILRLFDEYGKEMKILRNLKQAELYTFTATSYTALIKEAIKTLFIKYKKKRLFDQLVGFNGIRIVFNKNTKTIRLITNQYASTLELEESKSDDDDMSINITQTIGRKTNW